MHYHLEIIMPPAYNIEAAVSNIMAPFDENGEGKNYSRKYAFWDFWNIGGRYSGTKMMQIIGNERIQQFRELLNERHITVNKLKFGKPTLNPPDQTDMVNALWSDTFPNSSVKTCPLFDNYTDISMDIMTLKDVPRYLTCERVIVAGPDYNEKHVVATTMISEDTYNGVSWQRTTWDRTIGSAIEMAENDLKYAKKEYAEKRIPADDWLVVTVDYHS